MHLMDEDGKPVETLRIRETVIVKTDHEQIRLRLIPEHTIPDPPVFVAGINYQLWFGKNTDNLVADLERFADDLKKFCSDATSWGGEYNSNALVRVQAKLEVGIRTDTRSDKILGEKITPQNIVTVAASLIANLRKDRGIEL